MKLPLVGAQFLVFGKKYNVEADIDAILNCVANAGYKAVEAWAKDPVTLRKKLAERGLVFGASHVSMKSLLEPAPIAEFVTKAGGNDVCISALMDWNKRSLEDYREGIKILNEAGKKLRDKGIHLHYHNHDFEFSKVDGAKTGMDLLIDGLDFSVVDLCIDVAWVMRGGSDPAEFLLKHKDKIGFLHFKDFNGTNWIELGQGKVDFSSIMKVLPQLTKVRWVMIEQDETTLDPMDSVTLSRKYLKETFDY